MTPDWSGGDARPTNQIDEFEPIAETTKDSENTSLSPKKNQAYFANEKILIPETDDERFSFRKLWAFTGPGFLMSIAFLDPGNIQADLESGITAKYKLLWVLLTATILGLVMQRLSARLGVVTGLHLAEMCHRQYKVVPRILLWIMTEIAIIGSDMQEVIGTAIAIHLLSSKAIPIWVGIVITVIDTFTFLLLDKYGLRKLEMFFGFLIAVMAVTFGYEYVVSAPPQKDVITGMFAPWYETEYNDEVFRKAVEVIGAVIMPHNLYLHSALVKSRNVDRSQPKKVKEANKYYFIEAAIALLISYIINVFVVSVFAFGLNGKSNRIVNEICVNSSNALGNETFPVDDKLVDADLFSGGVYLGCQYGIIAMYIWGVGILAAGQSSTMTGTYAGQFAMEGFLNLQWPRWKRVLFTRLIAIVPTFFIAFYSNLNDLSILNNILNGVMTMQLPFAALPTIAFTSSVALMGEFKNGIGTKILATLLSLVVIGINTYFVIATFKERVPDPGWLAHLLVGLYCIMYILFCLYLAVHMAVNMGMTWLMNFTIIAKYVGGPVDINSGLTNPTSYARTNPAFVSDGSMEGRYVSSPM